MKASELLAANIARALDPDNLSYFGESAFLTAHVLTMSGKIGQ